MQRKLHCDYETFSEADLKSVGAYRYAHDNSTEILCCAFALDDGEPVVWHPGLDEIDLMELEPYFAALRDSEVLIVAHNSMFELAVSLTLMEKTFGIPCPDISRFRCTMSMARRAALPGKLGKLAEVLGLPQQKDTRGRALIKKFCVMQPPKKPTKKFPQGLPARRIRPQDEPEAFQELLAYCQQDIRTEQCVFKKLAYFDDEINNRNFILDQRINARGVPVNLAALRHAQKLIDEETEIVSQKFRELTGFEVTQNAVLLKWLNEDLGYSFPDLQAETIDTFLQEYENTPSHPGDFIQVGRGVEALRLKQSIAYASIKKVHTMLECAGPEDNRIRGTKIHHGAGTGRWSDSLVQFGNMKRPTIKYSEEAYWEICAGISREMLEICYGPVLEVISSCIRHFCQDV